MFYLLASSEGMWIATQRKTSMSRTEPWRLQQPLGAGRRMQGLEWQAVPSLRLLPPSWPCHPAVTCEGGGSPLQPVQQGGSVGQPVLALRPGEGGFASQTDCVLTEMDWGGAAGTVMHRRSSQGPERWSQRRKRPCIVHHISPWRPPLTCFSFLNSWTCPVTSPRDRLV